MKLVLIAGCMAVLTACSGAPDMGDEPTAPTVDTSLSQQKKPLMIDFEWEAETCEFSKTSSATTTTKK